MGMGLTFKNSLYLSTLNKKKSFIFIIKLTSASVLPEYNLFISSVFGLFTLEMNFKFSMLFQRLKHYAFFRDMDGKYLLSLRLR